MTKTRSGFWVALLLLAAMLCLMFRGVFVPGQVLFSNDGPLGSLMAQCHRLPDRFFGSWHDLNLIGYSEGSAPPNIDFGLQWLLGPLWFSKLFAPLSLLLLGIGAWCFLRQLGLSRQACILGALAAVLNTSFFSAACWGVASHAITVGMCFFALAAMVNPPETANTSPRPISQNPWLRAIVAGLAVGMGVNDGADIGAMFSLCVVAFVLYQAWISQGQRIRNCFMGIGRLAVVTVFSLLVAAQAISGLVATDIKGVMGTEQDAQTKAERWGFATQWSLPKSESLGLVVPGLFGFRMDTPDGGAYWGATGRSLSWENYLKNGSQGQPPADLIRFTGGGFYAGVLVVLVAAWAALQSLRRTESLFNLAERRWLWFWMGLGLVSFLLALGRYAPFYKWFYALPYVSTIRNPTKFLHVLSLALVVMFAYGVESLWRKYLPATGPGAAANWPGWSDWWDKAPSFDRRWAAGCLVAIFASVVAWGMYGFSHRALVDYLQTVQFDGLKAEKIAAFSVRQVGWFLLFFILSAGLLGFILSGAFRGARARWGIILLGLLLVADLGRANQPWIFYWDVEWRYGSNPIVERLLQHPFEHRVTNLPYRIQARPSKLDMLYKRLWMQHLFPYHNIQSLDLVQLPRVPEDIMAYEEAFHATNESQVFPALKRHWQLTNARYLLGVAAFAGVANKGVEPGQPTIRMIERFNLVPKPGVLYVTNEDEVTAQLSDNGQFALFEYEGALPRAKLFSNWEISTNGAATLATLASPAFRPEHTVLVAGDAPAPPAAPAPDPPADSVAFVRYAPMDILLSATATVPSVLLLNDRFDPHWKVWVDGRRAPLLLCNFIMRGVSLTPGTHTVEFRFQPPVRFLHVSLAAMGCGVLALVLLLISPLGAREPGSQTAPVAASFPLTSPTPAKR